MISQTPRSARKSLLAARPPVSPTIPIASLLELETPFAVVDANRLSANIAAVATYAREHGLQVRPHIKTHKSPEIAEMQLEAGAVGMTCSTAREAEVAAEVTDNVLVAFPPVDPGRIERLVNLTDSIQLSISVDSMVALERLQKAMHGHAVVSSSPGIVDVLVDVDLGVRRTGVTSEEELVQIAQQAQIGSGTRFAGMLIHPGHILHARRVMPYPEASPPAPEGPIVEQMGAVSEQLKGYIAALQDVGLSCSIISGGNSPSLYYSHLVPELTEIRPGTYVYCDRDMATQGIFGWEDCAYSVLSTVVSTKVPGQAVIDAGTKALGKELLPGLDGYGALLDQPEVLVSSLSEEHGILDLSATEWRPQVGDRVRIVPNHVCISVHLHDRFALVDMGSLSVRPVTARGR